MIVVEVDLHPGGGPDRSQTLALVVIWNDETGIGAVGNYGYAIVHRPARGRGPGYPGLVAQGLRNVDHRGHLTGIPRNDVSHLTLVAAVLNDYHRSRKPKGSLPSNATYLGYARETIDDVLRRFPPGQRTDAYNVCVNALRYAVVPMDLKQLFDDTAAHGVDDDRTTDVDTLRTRAHALIDRAVALAETRPVTAILPPTYDQWAARTKTS